MEQKWKKTNQGVKGGDVKKKVCMENMMFTPKEIEADFHCLPQKNQPVKINWSITEVTQEKKVIINS